MIVDADAEALIRDALDARQTSPDTETLRRAANIARVFAITNQTEKQDVEFLLGQLAECNTSDDRMRAVRSFRNQLIQVAADEAVLGLAPCSKEAREKEITRLATIEECAQIAETLKTLHCWLPVDNSEDPNHHTTKHGVEIAAAIRALSDTSTLGNSK